MDLSRAIIVPKLSKYEMDMRKYGPSEDRLWRKYMKEGVNVQKIYQSHCRQHDSLSYLTTFFAKEQIVQRDDLTKEKALNASLVIAHGGDNHFQYVSHFVDSGLMMGINSDPLTSEGDLTYFTSAEFKKTLKRLELDDFDIELWTRLEATVDGKPVGLATCEYFLGESGRRDMSRHILEFGGKSEEQKCSGLLVATGAGSTGWYDSACRYLHENGNRFSRAEKTAVFLVTEPYRGRLNGYSMPEHPIFPGDELTVHSLNDSRGAVLCDSERGARFNRGSEAVIRISDKPLNVVKVGA